MYKFSNGEKVKVLPDGTVRYSKNKIKYIGKEVTISDIYLDRATDMVSCKIEGEPNLFWLESDFKKI